MQTLDAWRDSSMRAIWFSYGSERTLSLGKYKKLSAQYCGPYKITKKISDQAYELLLPPHVKVHNIFHISLLKKYIPDTNHILDDELPLVTQEGTLDITPKVVL